MERNIMILTTDMRQTATRDASNSKSPAGEQSSKIKDSNTHPSSSRINKSIKNDSMGHERVTNQTNELRLRNSTESVELLIDDTDILSNDIVGEDSVSLASLEDLQDDDDDNHKLEDEKFDEMESLVAGLAKDRHILPLSVTSKCEEEFDITARALKRTMSKSQELWNAITMMFGPCFCLYFLLAGKWLTLDDIEKARVEFASNAFTLDDSKCFHSKLFPNLYATPPWTSIAVALGIVLHAPASILYHLYCAYKIAPGPQRIDHWSRRLDQAMMHFMSLCWSYGSSGNWDYTLASMAFNFDSIYRLYRRPFRPRNVLLRFGIAVLIQTLPFLRAGFVMLCLELLLIYASSAFIFSRYPFGGYSHGIFHIVMAIAPPLVITASSKLPAGEEQIHMAALCAVSIID